MLDHTTALLAATMAAGTPLVYAALGELITEKSGVVNLGVEGMMLVGAIAAFATVASGNSLLAGVIAGGLAGMLLALVFAVLTLTLMANQYATGLALSIFGIGLSAFVGKAWLGMTVTGFQKVSIPLLSSIPVLGGALFQQDMMVYGSIALFALISLVLYKTKTGLLLRAVGESPDSAHAIGYPVVRIRYLATLAGGALCGVGGAYLSIVYTPMWVENMVAGRGWIALALTVFATWRPARILLGAYLFGGMTSLQFHAQGLGIAISPYLLSMLPYLATIVVLVVISRNPQTIRLHAPASLGKPFRPN
ncbi:ABC transporter permease [Leeia oryzae]|uniref:ABC transporter permease n=1 Tax=Leeia oryzae TaxID=356662 RepID=UPI000368E674|nr:ABC transporter permease [Leeia oryzae]